MQLRETVISVDLNQSPHHGCKSLPTFGIFPVTSNMPKIQQQNWHKFSPNLTRKVDTWTKICQKPKNNEIENQSGKWTLEPGQSPASPISTFWVSPTTKLKFQYIFYLSYLVFSCVLFNIWNMARTHIWLKTFGWQLLPTYNQTKIVYSFQNKSRLE